MATYVRRQRTRVVVYRHGREWKWKILCDGELVAACQRSRHNRDEAAHDARDHVRMIIRLDSAKVGSTPHGHGNRLSPAAIARIIDARRRSWNPPVYPLGVRTILSRPT